jgi:histidinol-phosphate aminotransferase
MNKEGIKFFYSELDNMGISYTYSHTNFVLINLNNNCEEIYKKLLIEGVITRPMTGYGLPKHIRVSTFLPEENERFIKSLKKVLK